MSRVEKQAGPQNANGNERNVTQQFPAACAALEALFAQAPNHVRARLLLSSVYLKLACLRDACEQPVAASNARVDKACFGAIAKIARL